MVTRALIALVLLATTLGAEAGHTQSGAAPAAAASWRNPESWARLRVGMPAAEVARILGEPGRVTRYYAFTRWEYPDALGKRVNFDERGRLLAWGARAR